MKVADKRRPRANSSRPSKGAPDPELSCNCQQAGRGLDNMKRIYLGIAFVVVVGLAFGLLVFLDKTIGG
jgi:hypothetical protein